MWCPLFIQILYAPKWNSVYDWMALWIFFNFVIIFSTLWGRDLIIGIYNHFMKPIQMTFQSVTVTYKTNVTIAKKVLGDMFLVQHLLR